MKLNTDFRELIRIFNDTNVEYMIVGAYALAQHGYPRFSGDIDFFYESSFPNAERIVRALKEFGYSSRSLTVEGLLEPEIVHQIGVAPCRVDLMNSITGVTYEEAKTNKATVLDEGLRIPIIGVEDMIRNKKASGRPKDLADIINLQNAAQKAKPRTKP